MGQRFRSCSLALAMTLALAAGATTARPASAAGEIYRWVDATGTVHYSQSAPQGFAYERVTPGYRPPGAQASLSNPLDARPAPATRTPNATPQTDTPAADAGTPALTDAQRQMESQLEEEAQARLAEVQSQRRQDCTRAREQFQQFTSYARIRVSDDAGGTKILGEDERQARIEEAKRAIVLNCEDGAG